MALALVRASGLDATSNNRMESKSIDFISAFSLIGGKRVADRTLQVARSRMLGVVDPRADSNHQK